MTEGIYGDDIVGVEFEMRRWHVVVRILYSDGHVEARVIDVESGEGLNYYDSIQEWESCS